MGSESLRSAQGPVHQYSESVPGQRELRITIAARNQIVHGFRVEVHRIQQRRSQHGLAGSAEERLEKQINVIQISRRTCAKRLDRPNTTRLEQSLHSVRIYILKIRRVHQQTGMPKRLTTNRRMEKRRVEIVATVNWNQGLAQWTASVHLMDRIGTAHGLHRRKWYTQWANQPLIRSFVVHPPYSFNITRRYGV